MATCSSVRGLTTIMSMRLWKQCILLLGFGEGHFTRSPAIGALHSPWEGSPKIDVQKTVVLFLCVCIFYHHLPPGQIFGG